MLTNSLLTQIRMLFVTKKIIFMRCQRCSGTFLSQRSKVLTNGGRESLQRVGSSERETERTQSEKRVAVSSPVIALRMGSTHPLQPPLWKYMSTSVRDSRFFLWLMGQWKWQWRRCFIYRVQDPNPYSVWPFVFGTPGSASRSVSHAYDPGSGSGFGSGSGSFPFSPKSVEHWF